LSPPKSFQKLLQKYKIFTFSQNAGKADLKSAGGSPGLQEKRSQVFLAINS
jgi:hypothetical protein